MMRRRVCVIGAGVIGLSTAINVIESINDVTVTIVAEHMTPNTTSDVAAGVWEPYMMGDTPVEKLRQWGAETYDHLLKLSFTESAGQIGVFLTSGENIYHNQKPDLFWRDIVFGCKDLTPRELQRYPGACYGVSFTTAVCQAKKYLPWLMKRFIAKGGRIVNKRVDTFEELYPDYDIIVNCSGLGAARLCGDADLIPTKGQIIKVSAPWIKRFLNADDINAYILVNSDEVILGGTHDPGVDNMDVDSEQKQRIWFECCRLMPSLKNARYLGDGVGLRPSRSSVRLETETRRWSGRQLKIIHNYGHGGGGIALHWGCAREATQLINMALDDHTLAKL